MKIKQLKMMCLRYLKFLLVLYVSSACLCRKNAYTKQVKISMQAEALKGFEASTEL